MSVTLRDGHRFPQSSASALDRLKGKKIADFSSSRPRCSGQPAYPVLTCAVNRRRLNDRSVSPRPTYSSKYNSDWGGLHHVQTACACSVCNRGIAAAGVVGYAQSFVLDLPRPSQHAVVTQRIGITDVTINYHRPMVNKRKVWGGLVPYGQVWRAGANENTTIKFTDPVTIEGKPLPKGTYGLHMIPGENEWTVFSPRTRLPGAASPTTRPRTRFGSR